MTQHRLAIAMLCGVLASHAALADDTEVPTPPPTPMLSITVTQDPEFPRFWNTVDFLLLVQNNGTSNVILSGPPVLEPPRALQSSYNAPVCEPNINPVIPSGGSFQFACQMQPRDPKTTRFLGWDIPSLAQRTYSVPVVTTLSDGTPIRRIAKVSIDASVMSVFYGGLGGALLLSVFLGVSTFLEMQGFELSRLLLGASRIPARTLQGGVCAVIVILVSKVSQGKDVPVSVSIADFQGGLIAGLFSLPVAKWLREKLR